MTKKILIVGGDSLIGKNLSIYLRRKGVNFTITSKRKKTGKNIIFLDLNNLKNINSLKEKINSFDVIIYCISMTNIRDCELNPVISYNINVKQTMLFFSLINKKIKVLYLSTASVFDGFKKRCGEREIYKPLNQYGILKCIVEKKIIGKQNYHIIRISKVISNEMEILLDWSDKIKRGEKIEAYTNRYTNPIKMDLLVNKILQIAVCERRKIIHLSNDKVISRYNFAKKWFLDNDIDLNKLKPVLAKQSFKQANLIKNTEVENRNFESKLNQFKK